MYYTIAFYIIIAILSTRNASKEKLTRWVCIAIAVYTSLRYNYPSDYAAYHMVFDDFANPNYIYDSTVDHFEYGWYLLCKLFAPVGFYVFVAFQCTLFAYGLSLLYDLYVPKKLIPLVSLGIVAMGGFEILLSAQRQMVCAAIFFIAYRKLIYGNIVKMGDLLKTKSLLYFIIIFICHYFHTSSIFLIIVPFLYLVPKRSSLVLIGLSVSAIVLLFYASEFLPELFKSASEQYGYYEYLNFSGEYSGTITLVQAATWLFQMLFVIRIYLHHEYSKDEMAVLLIAVLAILIVISGYSLGQISRLSHYIYVFTFMSICIVYDRIKMTSYANPYLIFNYIWVVWNLFKILDIERGTYYEYKIVLPYLFQ